MTFGFDSSPGGSGESAWDIDIDMASFPEPQSSYASYSYGDYVYFAVDDGSLDLAIAERAGEMAYSVIDRGLTDHQIRGLAVSEDRDLLFLSDRNNDVINIHDISDRDNPSLTHTINIPDGISYQGFLVYDDNSDILYITSSSSDLQGWDFSDLSAPNQVSQSRDIAIIYPNGVFHYDRGLYISLSLGTLIPYSMGTSGDIHAIEIPASGISFEGLRDMMDHASNSVKLEESIFLSESTIVKFK